MTADTPNVALENNLDFMTPSEVVLGYGSRCRIAIIDFY
jgi:hypothetical protein